MCLVKENKVAMDGESRGYNDRKEGQRDNKMPDHSVLHSAIIRTVALTK